jgi:phage tail sheath protein FI
MPVTVSYPGVYIEELPSSTHTITAAPTSVAVFLGYTHPFKTFAFNKAIELFSFSDYEREFGGLYQSDVVDSQVAYAVYQFFLNGGTDTYVVGLAPHYHDPGTGADQGAVAPAVLTSGGVTFTAREPTDGNHPLLARIFNLRANSTAGGAPLNVADITLTYGTRSETYRNVQIFPDPRNPPAKTATEKKALDSASHIQNLLGTAANPVSSLVSVAPSGADYGTAFTAADPAQALAFAVAPNPAWTTFNPGDFADAFATDGDLDKVPIFNLMVLPGVADNGILSAALAFCEHKQAFLIMDPPAQVAADLASPPLPAIDEGSPSLLDLVPRSINGALYFPYLNTQDPLTGKPRELPPGGFVAGIFAREDTNRGVWKAPAGLETTILNTTGVVERGRMTDRRQGVLNPKGVNCLRGFPGIGTVVYGARTLATGNTSLQQWWYVPVRRTALFIEQTLVRNLGWAVFEPNDVPLWVALRTTVENFMLGLFRQGAFQGTTPSQAFQVKCDATTTTQDDIDNGIVNIVVAFAPLKPAEFVVIKIAQLAGQTQA